MFVSVESGVVCVQSSAEVSGIMDVRSFPSGCKVLRLRRDLDIALMRSLHIECRALMHFIGSIAYDSIFFKCCHSSGLDIIFDRSNSPLAVPRQSRQCPNPPRHPMSIKEETIST